MYRKYLYENQTRKVFFNFLNFEIQINESNLNSMNCRIGNFLLRIEDTRSPSNSWELNTFYQKSNIYHRIFISEKRDTISQTDKFFSGNENFLFIDSLHHLSC